MSQSKSELEQSFDTYWLMLAPEMDAPETEYKFHPKRKWRFDRAWVDLKVAVEIDGGTFSGGRHVRGMGYHKQLDKQNQSQKLGWVVLRFDTKHIEDDPFSMIELVKGVLKARIAHGQ